MSYEEDDTCMSSEEEDTRDVHHVLWRGILPCHTRRGIHACHLRRRIHACQMRRRKHETFFVPVVENHIHHLLKKKRIVNKKIISMTPCIVITSQTPF